MKAKVTGVTAWQGTPTGGTLSIRAPRYVDSSGNASPEEYSAVLDVTHTPPRWMDALDPTRELYVIVQGPEDLPGVRATFYEVLSYGSDKAVRTEFTRKLISSDLSGLIFDYAMPEPTDIPVGFGDAPLTMRAAQQVIEEGGAVVSEWSDIKVDIAQSRAAADAAVNTLSKSSGRGIIRPTKAAGDTDFPTAAVGDTLTVVETEDVYLKLAGATDWGQPITNLSTGSVDVVRFGARPGKTTIQIADAIDAALAYSAATGAEIVFRQDITVGRTIVVPEGARFRFTPRAKLRPGAADMTVLRIPSRLCHVHAIIDTTVYRNYTGTVVEVDGTGALFNTLRVEYLRINMHSGGVTDGTPNVALALRSNLGSVSFASFGMVQINNADQGIVLHTNTINNPDGSPYTGGYVNGNEFEKLLLNGCREFIVLQADLNETTGNTFGDYQIQPRTDGKSQRAIILRSRGEPGTTRTGRTGGNRFAGRTWDWGYGVPDVNGDRIAIESFDALDPGIGNHFTDPVLNYANFVRIAETDVFVGAGRDRMAITNEFIAPSSLQNRSFTGDQNDALGFAANDPALTVTSTVAPSIGLIDRIFDPVPGSYCTWTALAGEVTVTVDFGATGQSFFDAAVLHFDAYRYPKNVKIEYQTTQGGPWVNFYTTTTNGRNSIVRQYPDWNGRTTIYAIRVTFSASAHASGDIRLARFGASIGGRGGQIWLRRFSPNLLGNPTINGNSILQGGKRVDVQDAANGGEALRLYSHPTDQAKGTVELDFYKLISGVMTRAGWIGYGSANFADLTLQNLQGSMFYRVASGGTHSVYGNLSLIPAAVQSITAAGTRITTGGALVQVSTNAALTLTATPAISAGYDGQVVRVLNVGSNPVTLQDRGTLAGSLLALTAGTVTLAPRQSLELTYSNTLALWVQTGSVVAVL